MRVALLLSLAILARAASPGETDASAPTTVAGNNAGAAQGAGVGGASTDKGTSTAPAAANATAAADPPCTFCTVPDGYTAESIPAPLHIEGQFSPRWRKAHKKAQRYLKGWSVEDKVGLVTGAGWMVGQCVGNILPNPSKNFSGLCLEDSPLGVRFADYVSAFPAAINVAST